MPPRRRCPTCGSKQWHKEPSSGLIACSEGHILQNYRNEAIEAEELGPHALRKRTLKSGRKKKESASRADPRLYHGARARFHYFECLQLLLRKQIGALRQLWELPPEFEIVCRDVWTLNLELLPNPPPAEPYHFGLAKEREEDVGTDIRLTAVSKPPSPGRDTDEEQEDKSHQGGDSEDEDDEDDEEDDEEMEALLQENSEIESLSDDEGDGVAEGSRKTVGEKSNKAGKRKKGRPMYESPASTIAVLVVAFWTMRIPVLYCDLIKLIEAYELPYLDPVARGLVPATMVTHLTKHNIQALSPYHAPSAVSLHGLASRLSRLLRSSYGILTPEANGAPILWRVASQALGGTPVLYTLIKRLGNILSLPLTLHHTLAPGLEQIRARDPTTHKYDNAPPEVGFVAAGIIVLKMAYGLDGRARIPNDPNDPVCALPQIGEYLQALKDLENAESKTKAAIFDSRCVGDLDEGLTDDYLDFCQRALVPENDAEDDALLADYFPATRGSDGARAWREVEATRRPLAATLEEEGEENKLRPGEGYQIYNSRDVMGELPGDYEIVLERGARWTGVDPEYLGGVIEMYERRFMRWWERKRRRIGRR